MSVIEINTLVLMLSRQAKVGTLVPGSDKVCIATWVLSRLLWFPYLAVRLALLGDYPSMARCLLCSGCVFGLTLLMHVAAVCVDTWNFLVAVAKRVPWS